METRLEEPTFNPEEQRRIFSLAAELQNRREGQQSLSELERAAAEAGISPELLREAASHLRERSTRAVPPGPDLKLMGTGLLWTLIVGIVYALGTVYGFTPSAILFVLVPAGLAAIYQATKPKWYGSVIGVLAGTLGAALGCLFNLSASVRPGDSEEKLVKVRDYWPQAVTYYIFTVAILYIFTVAILLSIGLFAGAQLRGLWDYGQTKRRP